MRLQQDVGSFGMPITASLKLTRASAVLLAAFLAPLLLVAWQIEPLYYSNQNTKYLHALANAGVGHLKEDWLAGTKDGLPLFTWLLEAIHATVGPAGYYVATLGGYFGFLLCALAIYRRVTGQSSVPAQGVAVFLAIIFAFATVEDLQQIVFQGFAEQYVLGGYFQTADFGVLLLLAVVLFDQRRLILPCVLAVGGAAMHPGYVVPAAVLVSAFLLYELAYSPKERKLAAIAVCGAGLAGLAAISLALKGLFPPQTRKCTRRRIASSPRSAYPDMPRRRLGSASTSRCSLPFAPPPRDYCRPGGFASFSVSAPPRWWSSPSVPSCRIRKPIGWLRPGVFRRSCCRWLRLACAL